MNALPFVWLLRSLGTDESFRYRNRASCVLYRSGWLEVPMSAHRSRLRGFQFPFRVIGLPLMKERGFISELQQDSGKVIN